MENINESNFSKSISTPNKSIFTKKVMEENFPKIFEFDWKNKWLKGEEYAYMLKNIEEYCEKFKLIKLPKKTHPDSIYSEPQNGMIYFVEGNSVGSDFGFPRVEIKKRYRWKKMNFTTDLPKKRPFVTYIVASAVKCEKFFPNSKNEGPSFRMHAVILNRSGTNFQKYKTSSPSAGGLKEIRYEESSSNVKIEDSDLESISEESEGDSQLLRQVLENDKNEKRNGREYILCHIRKIDSNYKASSRRKTVDDGDSIILNDKKKKKNKGPNSVILNAISSPILPPLTPGGNFSLVAGGFPTGPLSNANNTPSINNPINSMMNNNGGPFSSVGNLNDNFTNGSENSGGENDPEPQNFSNTGTGSHKQTNTILKESFLSEEDQVRFSKVPLNIIQYGIWSKAIDGNYNTLVNKWIGKETAIQSEPEEDEEDKEKQKDEEGENVAVKKKKLEEILNHELQSGQDEINYSKIFNLLNS